MNNSKKVGIGQEELMDHIMVSINLGSKQPDWKITGTVPVRTDDGRYVRINI